MEEMYKPDGETDVENGQLKKQVSKIIVIFTSVFLVLLYKKLGFLSIFKKNSSFYLKSKLD